MISTSISPARWYSRIHKINSRRRWWDLHDPRLSFNQALAQKTRSRWRLWIVDTCISWWSNDIVVVDEFSDTGLLRYYNINSTNISWSSWQPQSSDWWQYHFTMSNHKLEQRWQVLRVLVQVSSQSLKYFWNEEENIDFHFTDMDLILGIKWQEWEIPIISWSSPTLEWNNQDFTVVKWRTDLVELSAQGSSVLKRSFHQLMLQWQFFILVWKLRCCQWSFLQHLSCLFSSFSSSSWWQFFVDPRGL